MPRISIQDIWLLTAPAIGAQELFCHNLKQKKLRSIFIHPEQSSTNRNNDISHLSSSIQTILSASESHRINLTARGLYHRWGLAPRPEDSYSTKKIIAPIPYFVKPLFFIIFSDYSLSHLSMTILERVWKFIPAICSVMERESLCRFPFQRQFRIMKQRSVFQSCISLPMIAFLIRTDFPQ